MYNNSVYVKGETWWPSQQTRLRTPLSQANKFHFARFSSYTIKTFRTFSLLNHKYFNPHTWVRLGSYWNEPNKSGLDFIREWVFYHSTSVTISGKHLQMRESTSSSSSSSLSPSSSTTTTTSIPLPSLRYGLLHLGISFHGLEKNKTKRNSYRNSCNEKAKKQTQSLLEK